jgi:2-dehydro-3-deoxy-D-arabinonate dehydratase
MKLYRTDVGVALEHDGVFFGMPDEWDALITRDDLAGYLREVPTRTPSSPALAGRVLAPISRQEVWAAGVTYYRSRAARLEESRDGGGGSFYDRVYDAERPELFFKSAPWRVRGPDEMVRIRRDARWSVPEPEIALYVNPRGRIIGCTIGNDMSSRDIEGENPLYLPQAKIYDGGCALGPALLVSHEPLPAETPIELLVRRDGAKVVQGRTTFSQMRRSPETLVEYLYRETTFPDGCVLLTGTGIVPDEDFGLQPGDEIRIHVPPIGTLCNAVARGA